MARLAHQAPQSLVVHFIHKQYDTQTVNSVNVPVFDVQQSFLVDSYLNVIVKNVCEDRAQINSNKAPSNASFICTEDLSVNRESSQTIIKSQLYI